MGRNFAGRRSSLGKEDWRLRAAPHLAGSPFGRSGRNRGGARGDGTRLQIGSAIGVHKLAAHRIGGGSSQRR